MSPLRLQVPPGAYWRNGKCAKRPAIDIDAIQVAVREEADRLAVG